MKKYIALLAALTLIFTVSCSADSIKEKSDIQTSIAENHEVIQTSYKETKLPVADIIYDPIAVEMCGENCYCFYETSKGELTLTVLDGEQQIVTEKTLMESIGLGFPICMKADGGFYVLAPKTDFPIERDNSGTITNYRDFTKEGEVEFVLYEYDGKGNVTSENEVIVLKKYYSISNSSLGNMCLYGENRLILSLFDTMVILGTDGTVIDADKKEMQRFNLGYDHNGNVLVSNGTGFAKMNGETLKLPDDLNKEWDIQKGPLNSSPIRGNGQFTAFFIKQDGIYGFNDAGEDTLVYDRRPDDYSSDREIINIWQISGGDGNTKATQFNKSSEKYTARIYPALRSPDDLTKAVLTGDAPDVIEFGDSDLLYKLDNLGALADTNKLMNEYGGLTRQQLMPNVLEAFDFNGRLLALPSFFQVRMFIANKEAFGKNSNDWTLKELYDYYNNQKDGAFLFADSYSSTINEFCASNLNYWIDTRNKTDKFGTPEFVEFLKFAKETNDSHFPFEGNPKEDVLLQKEINKSLKENSALFYSTSVMGLEQFLGAVGEKGIGFDEAVMLNPPGIQGHGIMNVQNCFTVLEDSDHKEGAWEYISFLLSDEYQCSNAKNSGIFMWTNKKAFDISLNNCIKDSGEPDTSSMTYCYSDDGLNYTVEYPVTVTSKQTEQFRDFVTNCTVMEVQNNDVRNIICEEFVRYTEDEITAEECAEFIHNRVTIYLNENK